MWHTNLTSVLNYSLLCVFFKLYQVVHAASAYLRTFVFSALMFICAIRSSALQQVLSLFCCHCIKTDFNSAKRVLHSVSTVVAREGCKHKQRLRTKVCQLLFKVDRLFSFQVNFLSLYWKTLQALTNDLSYTAYCSSICLKQLKTQPHLNMATSWTNPSCLGSTPALPKGTPYQL